MIGSRGMIGICLVAGKGERSHLKAYAWAAVRVVACREPGTHGGWLVGYFTEIKIMVKIFRLGKIMN